MENTYPVSDMDMMVTWGDCDPAGISYYPRTFDWFNNGRMDFLSSYHIPYMDTFHYHGIAVVCLHADCEFKNMVRPEEKVTVRTTLTKLTRSRMNFAYQVLKSDDIIAAEGETSHAFIDYQIGKPFNMKRRFPALWGELMNKWPVFNE